MNDYNVWILDPDKQKYWVAGTPYGSAEYPLKTLKQWAEEEGADHVWNLAFFNMTGEGSDQYGPIKGRTLTYVKAKGKDVGYGGTSETVTMDWQNVFAGYKVAVKAGKKQAVSSSSIRARNANGVLKDGRIFIIQSCKKVTEAALVSYMTSNYEVDLMLIQDSGGSTGYYNKKSDTLIAGEQEGKNGRPVATVICAKDMTEGNDPMKYVIIDSGHNKNIAGKRSPDESLLEYEFNFDVANKIAAHLKRHGVKVEVMQMQTSSASADVNQRVKYANEKKPDILVSIHANAAGKSGWYTAEDGLQWNKANGWGIFCYHPERKGEGYKLAQCIQAESIPFLGIRDRGIKDGSQTMGVVARTTMPAVLVEHAFYTNRAECELLKTKAFREKCALADAKGILKYLGIEWKDQVADYGKMVQERFGFTDGTMDYLERYKYADDLLKRLATTE